MATAKKDLTDPRVQGPPELLTLEQVAKRLGVRIDYVKRRLIRTGKLPHIRIGKLQRVVVADLVTFIEQNRVTGHTFSEPSTLEIQRRLRAARRS
jgi:excisionase family DNA binding protein